MNTSNTTHAPTTMDHSGHGGHDNFGDGHMMVNSLHFVNSKIVKTSVVAFNECPSDVQGFLIEFR